MSVFPGEKSVAYIALLSLRFAILFLPSSHSRIILVETISMKTRNNSKNALILSNLKASVIILCHFGDLGLGFAVENLWPESRLCHLPPVYLE